MINSYLVLALCAALGMAVLAFLVAAYFYYDRNDWRSRALKRERAQEITERVARTNRMKARRTA